MRNIKRKTKNSNYLDIHSVNKVRRNLRVARPFEILFNRRCVSDIVSSFLSVSLPSADFISSHDIYTPAETQLEQLIC